MNVWGWAFVVSNLVYWSIFLYLLTRRHWSWAVLTVGIFHMLFAGVVSVAPIRSLLDPGYIRYGLGLVQLQGRAATLPAAFILGWALAAAWIAVAKGSGRWMTLIAVGDIFVALSVGGSIVLDGPQGWKLQLGESVSITGVTGLLVLLLFFTLPFVASAMWAISRGRSGAIGASAY